MLIAKSFDQANKFYQKSVNLSLNWLGRYYPQNDLSISGIKLEKIQAFSQHYFFSCLLENRPIEDVWVQYPKPVDKQKNRNSFFKLKLFLFRIKLLLWIIFSKEQKLVPLKTEKIDVIFLSSGRHLGDQLPLIKYLNSRFKILVVGKIPDKLQISLRKFSIDFISLENGTELLSPIQRLRNIIFFTLRNWRVKKSNKFLDTREWRERLWYLKLIQFPEIKATLGFAEKLFEAKRPFLVITTSSNDTFNSSFCRTAQKMGIKVAELDHGFTAWAIDNAFLNIDFKLGWGKLLASVEPNIEKITLKVGCVYLKERRTKKYPKIDLKRMIKILVLWTPPFGSLSLFKMEGFSETLKSLLIGFGKLPANYSIVIRSHLSYDVSSDIGFLKLPKNVKIFNSGPLDAALDDCDLVITQQTTAGFIAILYKKPLLFFDNSFLNEQFGHPFVKSKSAIEVPVKQLNNIDDHILKLIANQPLLKKQKLNQEKFIEDYFDSSGIESMRKIGDFVMSVISKKMPV